ncbi:hypothetical protein ACHQM5_016555 [Ranunculus cassubicifolius]
MAPSKLRKAIGAVKDRTSISLVKVSSSNFLAVLNVSILKATRHEEYPADERHIREIIAMTLCSRSNVSSCVNFISKRLDKTSNWTVALKTLMLIQRLLSEGDPCYEKEMFYATRRGTRLLNMADFRDHTKSRSWDYSAYVRTYALYLDEQLEFRMYNRRRRHGSLGGDDEEEEMILGKKSSPTPTTPVRDLKTDHIFTRAQHLQQLLERFLACKPTGPTKINRVVLASLYPIVKDSFQIYYDMAEIMNILIERFMELEVRDCVKVHDIFIRMSKQFDELDTFYSWCKTTGIARSSEYPDVDKIEQKKIDLMDEFIRDKMILAQGKRVKNREARNDVKSIEDKTPRNVKGSRISPSPPRDVKGRQRSPSPPRDVKGSRISPSPPTETSRKVKKEETKDVSKQGKNEKEKEMKNEEETDLLSVGDIPEDHEGKRDTLALALIDMGGAMTPRKTTVTPEWIAFTPEDDSRNWESTKVLNNQTSNIGDALDKLFLDNMYEQPTNTTSTLREAWRTSGSASSVAVGSNGMHHHHHHQQMLALPAPPDFSHGNNSTYGQGDPFSASVSVPPPAYVQMSEIDMKQKMLVEEQIMWQQYAKDGMHGHLRGTHPPAQSYTHGGGGYNRMYHH